MGSSLQTQFARLQQRYREGLAARWAQIEASPGGAALQDALHRLCGSAASYGFESLSRQARVAEQLALQDDVVALQQALRQLQREIALACSPALQP
jgi:HPt (histidine-containing phosphotransfer) domain-containing protein